MCSLNKSFKPKVLHQTNNSDNIRVIHELDGVMEPGVAIVRVIVTVVGVLLPEGLLGFEDRRGHGSGAASHVPLLQRDVLVTPDG